MAKYKDLSVDGTLDKEPDGAFNAIPMDTTKIKDQSVISETALNKMATSIPTPFARLFLYDTAFKELNAKENDAANKGETYFTRDGEATLYHHLVAECLDLLEFIFEYGNDRRFSILEWDVNKNTRLLGENKYDPKKTANTIEQKHARLGKALMDAIKNTKLNEAPQIYLFKWDDMVIGGTTPFTLVYASPNWRRRMNDAGLKLFGAAGNQLFAPVQPKSKVYSLAERSADFRLLLYCLHSDNQYANYFGQNGTLENLGKYIDNTRKYYEEQANGGMELVNEYNNLKKQGFTQHLTDAYTPLKHTSGQSSEVEARVLRSIPFYTRKAKPDTNSDYIIVPTVTTLPVEKKNGVEIKMEERLPLVLCRRELYPNARYWWNTPYDPEQLPAVPQEKYYERSLPGVAGSPVYPYLTQNDLFEDKIIYLGYTINSKRFRTCFESDAPFLLPIKPVFFQYFKTEDLETMVKLRPSDGPIYSQVEVSITIPVKGGKVHFSKTYRKDKDEYVDFAIKEGVFKLGIFPFYAYSGDNARLNSYKVMVARTSEAVLEFYNTNFVSPLGAPFVSKPKIRTEHNNTTTEYYTLGTCFKEDENADGTFTSMRLVKNGIGGMIVPKFQKVPDPTDDYVFCVDFGTANTNVAYAKTRLDSASGEHSVDGNDIKTLEFANGSDPIFDNMVMLNNLDSSGNAYILDQYINAEFIPNCIGKGDVKFPIRTIACTRKNLGYAVPELFGDANIALGNDKYEKVNECYKFETDLKWGKKTNVLNNAFFREIMWMCKNKVTELGGNPKFIFYFTYPQTMPRSIKIKMMEMWQNAALEVRSEASVRMEIETATIGRKSKVLEGVAPWYRALSLRGADVFHTENFINIDIGGGSTDIVYVTKNRNNPGVTGHSMSIKFAANDLWGDGVSGDAKKDNGFLNAFKTKFLGITQDEDTETLKKIFNAYEKRATYSADIISFLFSLHERFSKYQLDMESILRDDEKLRLPILMHFAGIIYYIARCLEIHQLPVPKHISFSGMGSLYVKNLADGETLSNVIEAIFNFVKKQRNNPLVADKTITTRFADNPKKITAEGGVLMHNASLSSQKDKVVKDDIIHIYLIKEEEEEEDDFEIKFENAGDFKERTLDELDVFLKLFDDPGFLNAIKKEKIPVDLKFNREKFMEYLDDGFELAKSLESANADPNDVIEDAIFFWPLKHAIYMLARDISNSRP